ncbi:hypothetical protein RCL_jg29473.t1 [Rhizophagus clarus]|uniref:Uncharacterized protein n=1 Tax=Rhizophagus clarus TaxID=94130 RepID=A0A8H3L1Y6_9GLOM|nr:hypothetical protein RCL_jg29473.t1 [Rhizophagus clarus]
MYYLDQLAEEDYWKAVEDYKNSGKELDYTYTKCSSTNRALKDSLYKKYMDLADKKEKVFAYQVEIEKILLQGGFAYKKDGKEKNRILDNIRILTNGLDPYKIPIRFEEPIWQPDYWGDEDPDDPANWQSDYSEDLSDFNKDPDYP